jgi:hypothetical protein
MKIEELAKQSHWEASRYVDEHTRNGVAVASVVFRKKTNGQLEMYYYGSTFNHDNAECGGAMAAFLEGGRLAYNEWRKEGNND